MRTTTTTTSPQPLTMAEQSFIWQCIMQSGLSSIPGGCIEGKEDASAIKQFPPRSQHGWNFVDLDDHATHNQCLFGKKRFKILGANINDKIRWMTFQTKNKKSLNNEVAVGHGQCGWVYRGYMVSERQPAWEEVAILEGYSQALDAKRADKTVKLWQDLHATSTSLLLNNNQDNTDEHFFTYLILPFLGNADLTELPGLAHHANTNSEHPASPSFGTSSQITLNIVKELHRLHRRNIAHLDIKPENIRFDQDSLACFIVDLERCKSIPAVQSVKPTAPDTPINSFSAEYVPPDACFDKSSDIFALSAVIARVFGTYPFISREAATPNAIVFDTKTISQIPFDLDQLANRIQAGQQYQHVSTLLTTSTKNEHRLNEIIACFIKQMASMNSADRPDINRCFLFFEKLNQLIFLATRQNPDLENIKIQFEKLEELNGIRQQFNELGIKDDDGQLYQLALSNPTRLNAITHQFNTVKSKVNAMTTTIRNKLPASPKKERLEAHLPDFKQCISHSAFRYLMSDQSQSDSRKEQLNQTLEDHKQKLIDNSQLDHHRHHGIIRGLSLISRVVFTICTLGVYEMLSDYSIFSTNTRSEQSLHHGMSSISKHTTGCPASP